jgi:hypothetical protein
VADGGLIRRRFEDQGIRDGPLGSVHPDGGSVAERLFAATASASNASD